LIELDPGERQLARFNPVAKERLRSNKSFTALAVHSKRA